MTIDLQLVIALQSLVMAVPGGTALAAFCAQWLMYAFAGFILYFSVDRGGALRRGCYEASASALSAFGIVYVISHWFERTRPFRAFPDLVTPLINPPLTAYSLPSGHAATSFALAASLALVYPRFAPGVFIVAVLISVGRVAVGVHYPSDVVIGAVIGASVSIAVHIFALKYRGKKERLANKK
ncbi:MAG: phosphatase PAP2 family protein [Patescibacteria group bacterium]